MAGPMLAGSYDLRLVGLSVLLAMFASFAGLDLGGRVANASGVRRALWTAGGAFALGTGIWSMHYIGMLAYRLPVPVQYDWPTVALSLLAAVAASGTALYVVGRETMTLRWVASGSLVMGAGIASMHYIGMEAMRLPAMCSYSPGLVALSVALAVGIAFVALWLTFSLRTQLAAWSWRKAGCALIMGSAIPVMHYVGMAAVSFQSDPHSAVNLSHAVGISSLGVVCIVSVTALTLTLVLATSMVDRRISLDALELESRQERYRLIIETTPDAFLGIDSAGLVTDWNLQAEATFGWPQPEVMGKPVSTLLRTDHSPAGKATFEQVLSSDETGSAQKRFEMTGIHRDGREFPVESALSWHDRGGQRLFAAFVHDVSERRAIEQERERAKVAAEAANRVKSQFLANMSHEFRTPLNGVIGMTCLLLEGNFPAEQRQYLETIKASADSLLHLVTEVLDFSKIEAGMLELEQEPFDLPDCIESTLKTMAVKADVKGIELLSDIAPSLPATVSADRGRLGQLITNLVGNAIKFTHQGEVTIKALLEADDGQTTSLHFIVSDTGIGIPTHKQQEIFESFSQADASTTREYGGTGLGLTISRRLAERMGGRLWVESKVGRGSDFHFTIRVPSAKKEIGPPADATNLEPLKDLRVLVVDDNRTSRAILDGMLRHWKMRVATAESGDIALEFLSTAQASGDPFRVVLTDLHMPEMDGLELARRIGQKQALSPPAILLLIPGSGLKDAPPSDAVDIAAHIPKPICQRELRDAILRAIDPATSRVARPALTAEVRPETTKSMRILVAEDNAVNQLLARRLLETRGHTVSIAANGRDALTALEDGPYDLVLMDIHMPVMDGIEATARLRAKEAGTGYHQSVIALTAKSMKGNREECLVAGMDGYLSKPIRIQDLDLVLAAHAATLPILLKQDQQQADHKEDKPTASTGPHILDTSELMERLGGDHELLCDLTASFGAEYPKYLLAARTALEQSDGTGLARAGHTLRGMLANLAASGPSGTAASLEAIGGANDLSTAAALLKQLEQESEGVHAMLESLSQETAQ